MDHRMQDVHQINLTFYLYNMSAERLTKEQALQKARHYCAYQERCHQEVRDKLYEFGLHQMEVEEALSTLIEENYLDEERFAIQFVGGKFRMKQWGKKKIVYELKMRHISAHCINKALKIIEEEDYVQALEKLAAEKWRLLGTERNMFTKTAKATAFLQQRGYEPDLIRSVLEKIRHSETE